MAVNHACSLSDGVVAAPEFDRVENKDIGESRDFVDGEHPESEEYELVNELVADSFVPAEEFVGQLETADA
jgi:hypothetical protein